MKLNFKKSLLSIFSSDQEPQNATEKSAHKNIKEVTPNNDFDKAISEVDIPDAILEKITDIVNKPLPEVILKTIDREAEKLEIKESLRPTFCEYIKYLLLKAEKSDGTPLFVEGDDNVELVEELEEKLKLASQREEDYKNRYLSAERQKRALNDKVRDLEEKVAKLEKDFDKSENARIESNNNLRQITKTKNQLEESNEQLKLEVEHYRQLEVNNNLMGQSEGFSESEFIESLKKKIITLETENGEMEQRLLAGDEHLKEVVKSFETALHVKEDLVLQAVEREKTLQARIESLQESLNSKGEIPEGGDEVLTQRLIEVTRKYQALQSQLTQYKDKIYEESEGELHKQIEQLNADLALTKSKLEEAEKNNNMPSDSVIAQMRDLREKLEEADNKASELQIKLNEANQEIEELKKIPEGGDDKVEELNAEITELKIELQNKDNIIAEANDKIEKIQIKRERVAENKKAAKQIEELTEKLKEEEKKSEKARRDAEIARMNVVALTNEVEKLRNSMPKKDDGLFEFVEDDWMVVMEPETEEEIRERTKREREKEQKSEEEKSAIDIPFEDPAQMKLWD